MMNRRSFLKLSGCGATLLNGWGLRSVIFGTGATIETLCARLACGESFTDNDEVVSLGVAITTADEPFADTSNDVWLDLGPKAWRLGSAFPRGITRTLAIDPDNIDPATGVPGAIRLFVGDLVYVRIEKKGIGMPGIGGLTNAPDHILDPRLGGWKPVSLTLFVNGRHLKTFQLNEWLKQGHPSLTRLIRDLAPEEQFVHGLRVNAPRPSKEFDELVSVLTTEVKYHGVSGWEPAPVQSATVVGMLHNPPSAGTDGFVSLDLEVETVDVNGRRFLLDGRHGVRHTRYLRIEHKHGSDVRFREWRPGIRLKVFGDVWRDTDRNTFFEVHPRSSDDITVLT